MESKFLTPLDVREITDDVWMLVHALRYQSKRLNQIVEILGGFVTDFASVPRLPFLYWFFGNIAHESAVVHDYLYQTHLVSKTQADLIFLEAMKVTGISTWRRYSMYSAVVLFGFSAYNSGKSRFTILNNSQS